MNPLRLKQVHMLILVLKVMVKIQILKLVNYVRTLKYQNIFEKACLQVSQQKIFLLRKVKGTVTLTYVISDLNSEEVVGTILKK